MRDRIGDAMKILDLFCGAGGAAMGMHRACPDAEIFGVDINLQPHYPFTFIQGDALNPPVDLSDFDFIWASPPCQGYSKTQRIWKNKNDHPKLINYVRRVLSNTGVPFTLENVEGSELRANLMLCGTMFGLRIIKHRYFECSFPVNLLTPSCNHLDVFDPWHTNNYRGQTRRTAAMFREAMGVDWIPMGGGSSRKLGVTGDLYNAIPPAYSEYILRQIFPQKESR